MVGALPRRFLHLPKAGRVDVERFDADQHLRAGTEQPAAMGEKGDHGDKDTGGDAATSGGKDKSKKGDKATRIDLAGLSDRFVPIPVAERNYDGLMVASDGALFYRVYLSRNLVIVVAGAVFLLSRQWKPLAILLTVTAALPLFDMSALSLNGVTPPAFHPVALALLALAAALLWRRARTIEI